MENKIKQITAYLRSTVTSQVNRKIKFKEDNYCYFSFQQLIYGKVDKEIFEKLSNTSKKKEKKDLINVIIVGKTVRTIFDSQEKKNSNFEDLTGIYFIPAILRKDGSLQYNENKLPWIPRSFLEPMIEPILSIGNKKEYDRYMSDSIGQIHNIKNWNDYITFVKELYENVTGSRFESEFIKDIELENQVYILKDNTINATGGILDIYDDLLKQDKKLKLYENFIDLSQKSIEPLIINDIEQMNKHCGQMGGDYPLSPSQRECVNHFNNMKDGEILAVNGPPGTGKTTLLQSIVANMYVECALKKEKPPLIVASSTNNQAVTNIIESFGKISVLGYSNLEERWIEGVNSFAVYFPSSAKEKEAYDKEYHYVDYRKEKFVSDIESEENIQASEEKFLSNCMSFFNEKFSSIDNCERKIYKTLIKVNDIRKSFLCIFNKLKSYDMENKSIDEFIEILKGKQQSLEEEINLKKIRVEEWRNHFKQMSIWYKLFYFIKPIKRKVMTKNRLFLEADENFIKEDMRFDDIEEKYSFIIKDIKSEISKVKKVSKEVEDLQEQCKSNFKELNLINNDIFKDDNDINHMNLGKINDLMDTTLRYIEFWLSVHYYESRWIKGEDALTENQKGKTYENILRKLFNRLSMITPCYVMTFYQLPKLFKAFKGNNKYKYLYNSIDLLIVDEAGQVSPEIAACSFSLAKKAVVVGDVYQIEPVWNVDRALDQALAIEHEIITNSEQYEKLEEIGVNASNSSVMKVACKSCKYKKYDNKGLFLSEHRRCYNEIISYCNELVYNGKLEPMRGYGSEDENYKLANIKHMGHIQVDTERSSKQGSSRYNENEIREIAQWITTNFQEIKLAYPNENTKNLVGVITPFKAHVNLMKNAFKKIIPEHINRNINVGTVHAFQGAEKRIIIMSTVYGKLDGCYFIDINPSMLNVAVSRSKDSFIVFGDINCLSNSTKTPSGLLKKYTTRKDSLKNIL